MSNAVAEPANETVEKLPTAARVKRIEDFVMADPVLKSKIEKSKHTTLKKGEESIKFPTQIVEITQQLMAEGHEPFTIKKDVVLKHAQKSLGVDGEPSAEPETATSKKESKASTFGEINENISVLALLLSASQIAKKDKTKGADDRRKRIEVLQKEYSTVAGVKNE